MINWECKSCGEKTEHKMKEAELEGYDDYKILVCQKCGTNEMVPEKILENREEVKNNSETEENKIGSDGGFDREVDPDCESGICGVR